jgi:hypothetical protein
MIYTKGFTAKLVRKTVLSMQVTTREASLLFNLKQTDYKTLWKEQYKEKLRML